VERGDITVIDEGQDAFSALPGGGVAASVHYTDGVAGANIFVMSAPGARALAAAMGAATPDSSGPLSELELSAIGEASNQMLASAASAISVVIGQEIKISPPDVRVLDARLDPVDAWGTAPHACSTSFMIAGEACRLVQLVPSAFLMRMARAIDEMSMRHSPGGGTETDGSATAVPITEQLGAVDIRVWAELGRAQLPLGTALTLPPGSVIDLDRTVDAPVDLFVNGLCFGRGHLLVTDDGEWAIQVSSVNRPTIRRPALVGGAGVVTDEPKRAEVAETLRGTV
jgi:flagellar motor switch protein FliN/FliY